MAASITNGAAVAEPVTPPVAGQTAGTTPTAGQPAAPWYADWKDESLRGAAELNHWTSAEDAARDAVNAQKLIGIPKEELVRVPKDIAQAKPEELAAIYDRLGRPKTPDDYKLAEAVPQGVDPEFANLMAPVLHKHGLTSAQAQGLAADWNDTMAALNEKAQREFRTKSDLEFKQLEQEWGNASDQNKELGRRAVRAFADKLGGTEDERVARIDQIERALGTALMLRMFAEVGAPMQGHEFIDGQQNGNRGRMGALTPEGAQAEMDQMTAQGKTDREYSKRLTTMGTPEYNRWNYLITMKNPGMELPKNVT